MMCKVTMLFLFGFLELRVLSLVIMLAFRKVAAFRGLKGLESEQNLSREEPVALGKSQSGRAWKMISGTSMPRSSSLLFSRHPYQ
eukprot:1141007-Pelagomonas_calceolata.AAC.2